MMNNHELANKLDQIAAGNTYDAEALLAAVRHDVTTSNDRAMLGRYLFGGHLGADRLSLQELANYIREV